MHWIREEMVVFCFLLISRPRGREPVCSLSSVVMFTLKGVNEVTVAGLWTSDVVTKLDQVGSILTRYGLRAYTPRGDMRQGRVEISRFIDKPGAQR